MAQTPLSTPQKIHGLPSNLNTTHQINQEISPAKQTMADQDSTGHLGSASWSEANKYEPGGEFHERATTFLPTVNWDVLSSISSRLRNGVPCKFTGAYSIGHFNMVRHIVFADGVDWVARVRLPELSLFGNREDLDMASILKVEIASMNFFR